MTQPAAPSPATPDGPPPLGPAEGSPPARGARKSGARTGVSPRVLVGLCVAALLVAGPLVVMRMFGWIETARMPTGGMSPAIVPGSHLVWERLSGFFGKPARGDIVVFDTSQVEGLRPSGRWIQRVAGLPGERLRLVDGRLEVDGASVELANEAGPIRYEWPHSFGSGPRHLATSNDVFTVPAGAYFLLGDNTTNSYDGRFWGVVPEKAIEGRVAICYWPPSRWGKVR